MYHAYVHPSKCMHVHPPTMHMLCLCDTTYGTGWSFILDVVMTAVDHAVLKRKLSAGVLVGKGSDKQEASSLLIHRWHNFKW